MGLRDIPYGIGYDPLKRGEEPLEGFYIPALKVSCRFDRLSCYFTLGSLALLGRGLAPFFLHGGRMRLLLTREIGEEEIDAIRRGERLRKEVEDGLLVSLEGAITPDFSNLSYLIASGRCEVRLLFLPRGTGLAHYKIGVFYDKEGDYVSFNGSENDTEAGLLMNGELVNVFRSWLHPELAKDPRERFDSMWENRYSDRLVSVPPTERILARLKSGSRGALLETPEGTAEILEGILLDVGREGVFLEDHTRARFLDQYRNRYMPRYWERKDGKWRFSYPSRRKAIRLLSDYYSRVPGLPFLLGEGASEYLEGGDYDLEKKRELALAFKEGRESAEVTEQYESFKRIVRQESPAPFRERQLRNAFFHLLLERSFDFSVPGTGKTWIALALYAYLRHFGLASHIAVICPYSAYDSWDRENRTIFPQNPISFERIEDPSHIEESEGWLLNYEKLTERNALLLKDALIGKKTFLVIDESHRVKNPHGQRARSLLRMVDESDFPPRFRLLLSGTPLPNSFRDLFTQLSLLYPDEMEERLRDFSLDRLGEADGDAVLADRINGELSSLFVRTGKDEMGVPPADPDDRTSLRVPLAPEESALLREVYLSTSSSFLLRFIRLLQATTNPRLLEERIDWAELGEEEEESPSASSEPLGETVLKAARGIGLSSKAKAALGLAEKEVKEGKKLVFWTMFRGTIDLVEEELMSRGVPVLVVDGRVDVEERERRISRFREGGPAVLLTNAQTLGESVSLHMAAHEAIYLEYGYNLAHLLQSKDRIHRVGLPAGTRTRYYFAIGESGDSRFPTLDLAVLAALDRKAERMRKSLGEGKLMVEESSPEEEARQILASAGTL